MGSRKKNYKTDEMQIEYGSYYDVLYSFAKAVVKLNAKAIDGEEPNNIKKRFKRLVPAFMLLCDIDES